LRGGSWDLASLSSFQSVANMLFVGGVSFSLYGREKKQNKFSRT